MASLTSYRERPHWSFSALNQIVNVCSLQFAFERLWKLPKAFTPVPLVFGSVFHQALDWMHRNLMDGIALSPDQAREFFTAAWERQVEDDPAIAFDAAHTPDSLADQGRVLVACAVENADPSERVLSVGESFAVPLAGMDKPLVGEFDLVIGKEGRKIIVDWKTASRRWSPNQADKSLQASAYSYAGRIVHGGVSSVRFDVFVKNKTPVIERHATSRTPDDHDRMLTLIRQAGKIIEAEAFLPNESGFYCASCPFQGPCKSWHRAPPVCLARTPAAA